MKTLDDKVKKKDDEINELKEENNLLKTSLDTLQKLFDKLIKFLKDRMFNKKEKDKYYDFSVDLYTHVIINDKEIKDIKDNYDYSKEKESKNKNDDLPFIEIVASDIYHILLLRKNSLLISNISKEVNLKNATGCEKFLKSYDNSIMDYIEKKIKTEINAKRIKKCDAHLISFVIYKVFLSIMFEYDGEIDEKKVTKEITTILKEGLLN